MNDSREWRKYWEQKATRGLSDFAFDRGRDVGDREIERLSAQELLEFIDPDPGEIVLDAGCGTGATTLLLHSKVARVIAMDYSASAVVRCQRNMEDYGDRNVGVIRGDLSRIPLRDSFLDKLLCLSVLQYLADGEARQALREAVRVLKDEGTIVLHVKNLSSLYIRSLWAAKRVKLLFGMKTRLEHVRPYQWYISELETLGFEIVAHNSFNIFVVEGMPKRIAVGIRKLELRYCRKWPIRSKFLRCRGADLKIKAKIHKQP
jgi:ubiquinone/menaquinone biosynthesis C-methylase UbiE